MRMDAYGREVAPPGLVVERVERTAESVRVFARSGGCGAACPACGVVSRMVRSRYGRQLADLPAHGRHVVISVEVRRFRCAERECARRIFAERLEPSVARAFARRTERLDGLVQHLGRALGGRPGQRMARRLLLPVSKDTLLRTVRRRAVVPREAPKIIGVDDWAWRKGHRYGTLICDLERRRVIDLLPDREPATVAAWLAARPSIEIIARDRGGSYGAAAAQGRPEALQVADRWHLFENASAAFLSAVRCQMGIIRAALGQGPVDPSVLTAAERLQHDGWRRRAEADAAVLALHKDGVAIREIVRRTGRARKVVRDVVRGGRAEPFRPRASSLEPWLDRLDAEWTAGCRNGAELWRRLRGHGFAGSLRVIGEWATRRRRDEMAAGPRRCPSARALARTLSTSPELLSRADRTIAAVVEKAAPALVEARDLIDRFHRLIRGGDADDLDPWMAAAAESLIRSFSRGVAADRAAIRAAIVEPWSNGQTEGQITKLKLVKRQMYGRANLDLLRARLLSAP
jgi:transposase